MRWRGPREIGEDKSGDGGWEGGVSGEEVDEGGGRCMRRTGRR